MMPLRSVIAIACLTCTPLSAQDRVLGIVTTQELNLRAGPSADTAVLGRLTLGRPIQVIPTDGQWVRVFALLEGKMIDGWVNRQFITFDVAAATPAPGAPPRAVPVPGWSPPPPLRLVDATLSCREDYVDGGFERCTIDVDVEIRVPEPYAILVKNYADVACDAILRYREARAYFEPTIQVSENSSVSLRRGSGYETITIDVRLPFTVDPIVHVRIEDVACEIQG